MDLVDVCQSKENLPIFGPLGSNCFEYVKTNVPGPDFDVNQFLEEYEGCVCTDGCDASACPCVKLFGSTYDDNGLLNRHMWCSKDKIKMYRSVFECGQNCACCYGSCSLRVVQRGITANLQVFRSELKGFGLKCLTSIQQLRFVCEYAGEVVGENEAKSRLKINQDSGNINYLIAVQEETSCSHLCHYVDPSVIGNVGRFINHSCDPNLVMLPVRVNHPVPRLALFARRDIGAGDELTFDYSGKSYFTSCSDIDEQMCTKNQLNQAMTSSISSSRCEVADQLHHNETDYKESLLVTEVSSSTSVNKTLRGNFAVDDRKKNRIRCLCQSQNCSGLLPYDASLFDSN